MTCPRIPFGGCQQRGHGVVRDHHQDCNADVAERGSLAGAVVYCAGHRRQQCVIVVQIITMEQQYTLATLLDIFSHLQLDDTLDLV